MIKEIAVRLTKPAISALFGMAIMSISEIDSLSSILGITNDHEYIELFVKVIGGGFFLWRAIRIADKTIKEKTLAAESAKIKNESDAYDLAKKKEDDKNEGMVKEMQEMRDAFTELTQTIKNNKQ